MTTLQTTATCHFKDCVREICILRHEVCVFFPPVIQFRSTQMHNSVRIIYNLLFQKVLSNLDALSCILIK